MDIVTSGLIELFSFLLPGFITSFLFYSLTSFPKKSEFEAVVIALVHTIIIKVLVKIPELICLAAGNLVTIGAWTQLSETAFSIIIAVCIGLLWAYWYNNDVIHKILRNLKITKQTSYPSEWYKAFSEIQTFIILNLKDGKRIMGWPLVWPNYSKQGHFILEQAKWLTVDEDGKSSEMPLETVDKIMIDTVDVDTVEFLKFQDKLEGESHEC